jgi:diguanylate cyclase (GGDEF)-like protein
MSRRKTSPRDPARTRRAIPRLAALSGKRAFLLVLAGPQFGEVFPLATRRELLVGRCRDADIQVREDAVSRRHASLRVEGEGALVTDLGSANGTWVDGKRVPRARVNDGSRIHVGAQTTLKFIWADELDALHQMKLAQRALRDPLTNLYNRRYIDERLGSEIASLHSYGKPLALLLVDIDRFKDVNDEWGHLAGDEALETVASTLRGAVRKDDVLARYGGDEFVVIARETTLDGGCALGQRIRSAVERLRSVWKGRERAVTVSVGVTIVKSSDALTRGISHRDLLATADRALYLAKRSGGNRVVALPVEAPGPSRRDERSRPRKASRRDAGPRRRSSRSPRRSIPREASESARARGGAKKKGRGRRAG